MHRTVPHILIVCAFILLQGCSWTYIHSVPEVAPTAPPERATHAKLCTENQASFSPTGDLIVTALQAPFLGAGLYAISMEQGDMPIEGLIGIGVVIVSATTALLHGLSWYYGAANQSRCEGFLQDFQHEEPPTNAAPSTP